MSLSATLFGRNSVIFKATNILGLGIPGWLDKQMNPSTKMPTQPLGELASQTAKEAEPRPIIWGIVRPIGGNLMHVQTPVRRWVVETQSGGGGKGGGKKKKQQVSVEHVYRTYAVGVCEGPITGFGRIWRNNKLIYDGRSGSTWGKANNSVFFGSYRLYLGAWDQMPSPDLQAVWGKENVPAYRGTAYLVSVNEDLTDMGGAVPQFIFEVIRAEGYALTTRPYAAESVDELDVTTPVSRSSGKTARSDKDALNASSMTLTAATLTEQAKKAATVIENIDTGITLSGAVLKGAVHVGPETLEAFGVSVGSGTLDKRLVTYENYATEATELSGITLLGGVKR